MNRISLILSVSLLLSTSFGSCKKVPDPKPGETFTCLVNGKRFTAYTEGSSSIVTTPVPPKYRVLFNKGAISVLANYYKKTSSKEYEAEKIRFSIRTGLDSLAYVTPGSYELYYCSYDSDLLGNYENDSLAKDAMCTITTHDTLHRNLKGKFQFVGYEYYDRTRSVNITEGVFDLSY